MAKLVSISTCSSEIVHKTVKGKITHSHFLQSFMFIFVYLWLSHIYEILFLSLKISSCYQKLISVVNDRMISQLIVIYLSIPNMLIPVLISSSSFFSTKDVCALGSIGDYSFWNIFTCRITVSNCVSTEASVLSIITFCPEMDLFTLRRAEHGWLPASASLSGLSTKKPLFFSFKEAYYSDRWK